MWSSEPIPLFAVLIVLPNEETNKGPAQLLRTLRWIILPFSRLMTPWRIPSLLTSPLPMAKERALRLSQKTTHRCILLKVLVTHPLLPTPSIAYQLENERRYHSRYHSRSLVIHSKTTRELRSLQRECMLTVAISISSTCISSSTKKSLFSRFKSYLQYDRIQRQQRILCRHFHLYETQSYLISLSRSYLSSSVRLTYRIFIN